MIATLAILLVSGVARSQEVESRDGLLDPLPIRDQFLLNNGFFFFEPQTPRTLAPGESILTFHATDANTFAKSGWVSRSLEGQDARADALAELAEQRYAIAPELFLIDGETHRSELAYRRGFGDHLEIGISVPVQRIGGGWSDRLIESVHHTLEIGNAERESLRQNSETVFLRTGAMEYTRNRSAGWALGDVSMSAKLELTPFEERGTALALAGAVEFPTGNAKTLDGSGSFDGGLQLIAAHDVHGARIHASLGLLWLGPDAPLGTKRQFVVTDTVGVSHMLTARTAGTVQLTVSECPFRQIGIAEFGRRAYQLSVGARHAIGRSTVLYGAFIENLFNYDNSADAGFAWGISRRF